MSNIVTSTKFVLKFDFTDSKFSASCEEVAFERSLLCEKFTCHTYAKNELIKQFIKSQAYNEPTTAKDIWIYDMKQNSNTTNTATVYKAPRIDFKPTGGDFETMQAALTQSKIGTSFFDANIKKHLKSAGVDATRENVQIYRASYKDQISKLLLEEILKSKSVATVRRWFDKVNGNSYASVNLRGETYQLNIPMSYGYGDAVHVVMSALGFEAPRTMRSREFLTSLGMTVVDLGYSLKREMFTAAFRI